MVFITRCYSQAPPPLTLASHLDDADLVGHVERVVVRGEAHVRRRAGYVIQPLGQLNFSVSEVSRGDETGNKWVLLSGADQARGGCGE